MQKATKKQDMVVHAFNPQQISVSLRTVDLHSKTQSQGERGVKELEVMSVTTNLS